MDERTYDGVRHGRADGKAAQSEGVVDMIDACINNVISSMVEKSRPIKNDSSTILRVTRSRRLIALQLRHSEWSAA